MKNQIFQIIWLVVKVTPRWAPIAIERASSGVVNAVLSFPDTLIFMGSKKASQSVIAYRYECRESEIVRGLINTAYNFSKPYHLQCNNNLQMPPNAGSLRGV